MRIGLLEESLDVLSATGLPDRHDARMLGCREAGNILLGDEDPRRGVPVAIEEMLAQGTDVLARRIGGESPRFVRSESEKCADGDGQDYFSHHFVSLRHLNFC